MPDFWKHKKGDLQFILVVDYFGIKYIKKANLNHLIALIKKYYDVIDDLEGKKYVKIELNRDNDNGVNI